MGKRSRYKKNGLPSPSATKSKIRRREPIVEQHEGAMVAMCPFCASPHPISMTEVANCGTVLQILAVQQTFTGKHTTCKLCGKAGGTMVKVGEQYVHSHDCTPGVRLHAVTPDKSFSAALAWRMPDKFLLWYAKRYGKTPQALGPLDKSGKITKVEGYAWQKITMPSST